MPTIDELKADLESTDQALRTERYKGGDSSQSEIARLEQKYQELQAQINQAQVDTASDAIAPSTEEIKVGDSTFSIDDLATGPDEAMIIRQFLRQLRITAGEQESAHIATVQTLNAKIAGLEDKNTDLEDRNGALELRARDAESKRDAAVAKAEELQRETDRLNSLVDDLQKEKAIGVRAAIDVIEINTEDDLNAAAERIKARKAEEARIAKEAAEAAKIRVYDLQEGDLKVSFYTAKRADNDESINIPRLELAKYVVLSNEEAARFRQEHQAAEEAIVESVPAAEEASEPVVPEVPFRNDEAEDAQHESGLGGNEADASVVGQTVEQRLAALEEAVFGQAKNAA